MSDEIKTGDITGTGIAVGHGARAQVKITVEQKQEMRNLVSELKEAIRSANLSNRVETSILERSVPKIEQALESPDPKSGIETALSRINGVLEATDTTTGSLTRIANTVAKLAGIIGLGVKKVAPYLAGLL
jgi:hypothetical protein